MRRTFRKIKLLVLVLIILFSGCKKDDPTTSDFSESIFPDENALSWDFPVKPGSEKWKSFQSYNEMVEACQIPERILSGLRTEELVLICLKYPLLMDIGAFNFFTDGYASYENNFNGVRELYKRNNAPSVLYNYYHGLNLEHATFYSSVFFVFRVSVVEYMVSAPSVISNYTARQRKEVAGVLLSNLVLKKAQEGDFPNNYLNSTYRALIRIIKSNADGILSADDAKLAGYFTGIGAPPENVVKQVEEMITNYFSAK